MSYQEHLPHPSLTPYIKCLWTLSRDFDAVGGAIDLLPDSYIEVIFNSGHACVIDDGQTHQSLPPVYAMTLFHQPLRLSTTGLLHTIGVRFYAWGFSSFFNHTFDTSRIVHPLSAPWQRLAYLMGTKSGAQALQALHAHLLHEHQRTRFERDVAHASHQIYTQRGSTRIEALAESVFLSRRQLERKFKTTIGLSPKMLARQMRFEQVRDDLSCNPAADLSALAQDYGYADQAHLSRDFKVFSHRTPAQFAVEIRGISSEMRYGVAFPESSER